LSKEKETKTKKKRFLHKYNKEVSELKEKKEEEFKETKKFSTYDLIGAMILTLLVGLILGVFASYSKNRINGKKVDSGLAEIASVYNELLDSSYNKTSKKSLVNGAIKGMISKVNDQYTTYYSEEDLEEFNQSVENEYVGVGMLVSYADGVPIVDTVYENTPAEEAGIKEGDEIIEVDGIEVDEENYLEVIGLIAGDEDTTVDIKVKRNDETKEFSIERKKITLPSVTSEVLEDNIGFIVIDTFSKKSYKEFKTNLEELESKNIKSLIIDVRSNEGGHLEQALDIVEMFLEKGTVIYQEKDGDTITKIKDQTKESKSYPIVVLQDYYSASASELLSSALKEQYNNVTIVGNTSYGKGTMQELRKLKTGSYIKYTTLEWLTSKGNTINEVGVSPDVEVELSEDYYNNPSNETDNQLQEAIKILKNKVA